MPTLFTLEDINNEIEQNLTLLKNQQGINGEFITLRRNYEQNLWTDWHEDYPSPFFTADILYCLLMSSSLTAKEIINKSLPYLKSGMEQGGLWRFWPSLKALVPTDTDGTALISFVLTKCGEDVSFNKKLFENNKDTRGYFYTWFYPRWSNFYNRILLRYYLRELPYFYMQLKNKWTYYNDQEAAVAAHVILYLGESDQTLACINAIIEKGKNLNIPGLYYKSNITSFYHISKAYLYGVKSFVKLKETVILFVQSQIAEANFLEKCMLLATLLNYGIYDEDVERQILSLKESEINKTEIYTCFYNPPGSVEWACRQYTLALYLEVLIMCGIRKVRLEESNLN